MILIIELHEIVVMMDYFNPNIANPDINVSAMVIWLRLLHGLHGSGSLSNVERTEARRLFIDN